MWLPDGPEVMTTSGSVPSTVHGMTPDWPTLPAASVARMRTVCAPSARTGSKGLSQACQGPPSTWHWVTPGSSTLNTKRLPAIVVTPVGRCVTVTTGAVASTVHGCTAGVGSSSPPATAFTRKVCGPSASGPTSMPLTHGVNDAAPSSRQTKVAPAVSELKVNAGVVSLLGVAGALSIVVSGSGVSTTQLRVAMSPVLPALSVARTRMSCGPWSRDVYDTGLAQLEKGARSRLHSVVTGDSSTVKVTVALVCATVPVGPPVIVTVGATVSTTSIRSARPVLPAASVARICRRRTPSVRPAKAWGDVHGANAPSSTRQAVSAASLTVKPRVALVVVMEPTGPEVIVTTGATVSTRHCAEAGSDTLPTWSVALTSRTWVPSASPLRVVGDVHVDQGPPSSRHSTVASASSTVKLTVPLVCCVGVVGRPVMVTTGATPSTSHVRITSGPTLPAASVARTQKVWEPAARTPSPSGEEQAYGAPPSRRQVKSAGSSATNVNVTAPAPTSPDGPEVMVVVGPTESTTQDACAGDGSRREPWMTARTSTSCAPWLNPVSCSGLSHVVHAPPSTRHSKVTGLSGDVNAIVAEDEEIAPDGAAVIVVSGGSVTIVH